MPILDRMATFNDFVNVCSRIVGKTVRSRTKKPRRKVGAEHGLSGKNTVAEPVPFFLIFIVWEKTQIGGCRNVPFSGFRNEAVDPVIGGILYGTHVIPAQ